MGKNNKRKSKKGTAKNRGCSRSVPDRAGASRSEGYKALWWDRALGRFDDKEGFLTSPVLQGLFV